MPDEVYYPDFGDSDLEPETKIYSFSVNGTVMIEATSADYATDEVYELLQDMFVEFSVSLDH